MAKNTRELILRTSLKLFSDQGYHGATMRQIASKAGLSLGLAYRYFDSKEAILEAIISSHDKILRGYSAGDPNKPAPAPEDLAEYLADQIVNIVKDNEDYLRLYWNLMLQPKIHRLKKKNIHLINHIFSENAKRSIRIMRPHYTDFQIKTVTSAILGFTINYLVDKKTTTLEDIRQYILFAFREGEKNSI